MATYVGAYNFSASSTQTISVASGNVGAQVGDLILAQIVTPATITAPTGWTQIRKDGASSLFWKIRQAGDPSNYTFTLGSATRWSAGYICYRNLNATNPIGAHAGTTTGSNPAVAPSVTAPTPGLVCRFYGADSTTGTNNWGRPSGYAERYDSISGFPTMAAFDAVVSAAGPTGTASSDSFDYAGPSVAAQTVVLRDQNTTPAAPTLAAPTGGVTLDRTSTQRFRWDFNDPDSGDTQSQFDLRYRIVGGSWTTVTGVTPNTYRDIDGGTFSAGDYEWQVRTYDAQGEVGPWSSSEFFTAATPPPGPTITAPTNGATIGLSETLVEWSYPSQEAYRLQVQDGSGGTLTDTGQVNSTTARSHLVDLPTNNVTRTVRLQVLDGGLWSAWVAVTFEVSYTPPPPPVVSLLPDTDDGALVVTITNPSSSAGEPATSYNDVHVTDPGKAEQRRATMVAVNGSWTYHLPVSGYAYDGSDGSDIRVVAVAENGVTSST